MKKLGVYFLVAMLMVSFVITSTGIQAYAATVGEQLLEPESGWRRYENEHSDFEYSKDWYISTDSENNAVHSDGSAHYVHSVGTHTIKFIFKGTKLRLIAFPDDNLPQRTQQNAITIDGARYTYTEKLPWQKGTLVYEINNLDSGIHEVTIEVTITEDSQYGTFDAIDIDETGELIGIPNTPTNLSATPGNEKVNLSWDKVQYADNYKVLRSTTEGGPYTTVEEGITGTSYTDTDVKNDTTYYYVVVAENFLGESEYSNEVSATPESSGSGDNALLRITMLNGTVNEYDLSMSDVEDFIDWYEDRADDRGKPYYVIEKNYNVGPFESRKDYLAFDKILQFEVMEYNK